MKAYVEGVLAYRTWRAMPPTQEGCTPPQQPRCPYMLASREKACWFQGWLDAAACMRVRSALGGE